jgi:hypothetical protein
MNSKNTFSQLKGPANLKIQRMVVFFEYCLRLRKSIKGGKKLNQKFVANGKIAVDV